MQDAPRRDKDNAEGEHEAGDGDGRRGGTQAGGNVGRGGRQSEQLGRRGRQGAQGGQNRASREGRIEDAAEE